MKIRYLLLIFFIFFIFYNLLIAAPTGQEPAKECALCHYSWMDVFMFEHKGTDLVDFPQKRVVASERLCFSCHDGTVVDSRIRVWAEDKHKVGVKPSKNVSIPKEFPLEDGKIQCKTCHTAHGTGEPEKEGISRSIFLRINNENSELCMSCHINKVGKNNHPPAKMNMLINDQFFKSGGVLGINNQVICESCHTPHGPKEKKLLLGKFDESELCSYCHTDKLTPGKYYKKGLLAHPVNIKFNDENKKKNLKKQGAYFFNDEIVCLTCHNTHKGVNKYLLIINNKNDDLCFQCHNDKKQIYYTKHNLKKLKNFKNKYGNSPYNHGVCSACHDPHGWALKLPNTDDDLLSRACFSCHLNNKIVKDKVIDKTKYNHPVFVKNKFDTNLPVFEKTTAYFSEFYTGKNEKDTITCATCHNSHIKSKNFLRKEVKDSSLCINCHKDKKITLRGSHGKNLNCLSCHKVHNSSNEKLLIVDQENICFSCHKKGGKAEKKLIGKNSHPINIIPKHSLPKNFKLDNGKLICITCHEPHNQGNVKKFLRNNPVSLDNFCTKCHTKKTEISKTEHDLSKEKKKDKCFVCHSPHNAKTEKYLFNWQITEENEFCSICHSKENLAKNKTVKMIHLIGKTKNQINNIENLSCISCHDPHINGNKKDTESTYNTSFLRYSSEKFCVNCHKDKQSFGLSPHNVKQMNITKVNKLFIKENDNCGFCHDIHFKKNKFVVSKEIGDKCEECHKNKTITNKKLANTSHPFKQLKESMPDDLKLRNGKIFCSTCHEPHAPNKNLLINNITNPDDLCVKCHKKKENVFYSEHNLKIILSNSSSTICGECHKAHNFPKENRLLWNHKRDNGDLVKEICFSCHSRKGVAKNKIVKYYGHPKIPITFKQNYDILPIYNSDGIRDIDGFITCSTCHDAHIWSEKPKYKHILKNIEGNALNSFLKYSKTIFLCNTCHGIEGLTRYKYYHTPKYRKDKRYDNKLKRKGFLDILIGD